ncbi:3-deoxy-D-manno-octulosonic acid transferase [Adhaeribacter radiodurans]|uniref:3-deoxy-D-manno-octulosonic acid transferase n=1 Tax=Adhaeribacter radiodurans TaxID=2745197 RepID=A0A7L7L569_9BACT|nr:glycosyltransferase N-terminal domain-containing protein [Adhaeribacter radiodurans]QMU27947.1 3-deoxy-D-manno-octulosonic acid transferase [Adhaeribacter radiodurans]
MTKFFYNLGIQFYGLLLQTTAPFHTKAGKWITGRQNFFPAMKDKLAGNKQPVIWFHCASLGEFEQGRPVIERIKQEYPEYKVALTFFSPSGYEVRKNYAGADYIFYLPLDTAANARKFVELLQPRLAVFVKYEFWYHYLLELHQRQIPVISISAIFRENQLFFKSYGGFYRNILKLFTHIFTQNENSAQLLKQGGINHVTIAGDTRFDRVLQTAAQAQQIPIVANFTNLEPVFIIGSSWPADMHVLLPFIQENLSAMRFIIAPHEIHSDEIEKLLQNFAGKAIRYSLAQPDTVSSYRVLIIDNVGLLASLYRYGTYAYIGGAFGKGLHNTLEAAVFGLPLFFGPAFTKFQEAIDLVTLQCAFPVQNTSELRDKFEKINGDPEKRKHIKETAIHYLAQHAGATTKILAACQQWLTNSAWKD